MKKNSKFLSAILALVMAFALTVPAFAATTYTGNQLYPSGDWGNGPSLTLTGVTGGRAVEMELPYCYDVEVGGSLVLDMPFPAGENRGYIIFAAGVYIAPDFSTYADNGQSWDIPAASKGGTFVQDSGQSQYVYNFTAADMGQMNGFEKAIYMHIYWETNPDGGDYADDSGGVFFYIHVVPAGTTSSTPTTPAQPSTPSTSTSTPSTSTGIKPAPGVSVPLNNGTGEFAYTIKSGDSLSGIAAYYYGNADVYKLIYERNKDILKSANAIYAGQTIILPSYASVSESVASTTASTPAASTGTSSAAVSIKPAAGVSVPLNDGSGEFAYTIKSGDTLSRIAAYYYGSANVYKLIYERNKDILKSANAIYAGQTIILPSYAAVFQGVAKL